MSGETSCPWVTIVTPSLNQGRYLGDAIASVVAQDYPHLEYLIFDAGSHDETAAVAARHAGRLTFVQEPDRGQSHAINKGFARARGEIVQWLNADDRLEPGAVAAVVEAFRRAPAAAAVHGHGYAVDAGGQPLGASYRAPQPFDLRRLVRVCDTLAQPCVFLRRAAVLEVGGLDESLHWSMDWDLYLRLAFRFPFAPVDRTLAAWRDSPDTKTRSGGVRRFRELARVLRRHGGRRFPPAYLLYLAQTIEFAAGGAARERRAAVARRLLATVERAAVGVQRSIWKRTLQWFSDGWAGPRLDLLLARQSGHLRLRGDLPPLPELCPGQRLTVRERGRTLATSELAPGPFELRVTPAPGEGPVALEIRARRSFVPGRRRAAPDDRRIAFRLDAVDWVADGPA
ncbi:MAG: glycosyltransferase family 2 protein [Thermoanaerobaculia bacterium]